MKERQQLTLKYPDAAIFALIEKGYPYHEIVKMMSYIAYVTSKHAEGLVNDSIKMLRKNNVIE